MIDIIKDIYNFIAIQCGADYAIFFLLLIGSSSVSFRLGKTFKFDGACSGFGYCRFKVFIEQLELIRRSLGPIKREFKQDFAMLLIDKQNIKDQTVTSNQIGRAICGHKTIIDAGFNKGKKEIINLMIRNKIPDADSASFRIYIDDNFSVVESAILEYIGEQWDENLLLISYQNRYSQYLNKRGHIKNLFQELMIEARYIGTKHKEGKK